MTTYIAALPAKGFDRFGVRSQALSEFGPCKQVSYSSDFIDWLAMQAPRAARVLYFNAISSNFCAHL